MAVNKKNIRRLAVFFGLFASFAFIYFGINSKSVHDLILAFLSNDQLKLKAESVYFNLPLSKIEIKNADVSNSKTGFQVSAESVDVEYSLLRLITGKLVIPELKVKGAYIRLPKPGTVTEEEKLKRISIKKLLILQSLEIKKGEIEQTKLEFGDESRILSDTIQFSFNPSMTGHVALEINLQGVGLKSGSDEVSLAAMSLKGKTRILDWHDVPPYANAIEGDLKLNDLSYDRVLIPLFVTKISLKDKKIGIHDFEITKNGERVKGEFSINLEDQSYKADLKIPEPIDFPMLGDENPTIDTSGKISGEINASGKGFDASKGEGKISISLKHQKEGLADVILNSSLVISSGKINLNNTSVGVGDGKIEITGGANIHAKKIDLAFKANEVPLDAVFGRFGDENFHPIFGNADAEAKFTGWGKDFRVTGDGETTGIGGYYKISCEKAKAKIDVTYQELNLLGEVIQGDRTSGKIDLKIKYGKKAEGSTRSKDLHIVAEVFDHNLSKSFEAYGLTGIGNGKLTIDGPQRNYNGKLHTVIRDGAFQGIVFNEVDVNTKLNYRKIEFSDGKIIFPNSKEVVFNSPIKMDFSDSGFRMYGKPLDQLKMDLNYRSKDASWQIADLDYFGLSVKGIYSPKGSDLNVTGSVDGEDLSAIKKFFREATGKIDVKLHVSGPSTNPSVNGKVTFNDNTISPRAVRLYLENVNGDLVFNGHEIKTENLTAQTQDSSLALKGSIKHESLEASSFDLQLNGHNIRYTMPDRTLRLEFDADLELKGSKNNPKLVGTINILDGKYTKDFNILESIGAKKAFKEEKEDIFANENLNLDLVIKNAGDLVIKNNIGDIWLKADIVAKGTMAKPKIAGSIEATEGKIRYLGSDFKITKGIVEFRETYSSPYLEITAEHDVPDITDLVITAMLHGPTDNLQLDLSATKPMAKEDIVSILVFGATQSDINESRMSSTFGSSMVLNQISSIIERPVTKLTHLDIFRIEGGTGITTASQNQSKNKNQQSQQISKMYVGKQISDRLGFTFVTEINTAQAQQALQAEYLLTDFLLLKGETSAWEAYTINFSLRFRQR